MDITNHQIGKIERKIMELAHKFANSIDINAISLMKIYEYEGDYQQSKDVRHTVFVQEDIKEIIAEVLSLDEKDLTVDQIEYIHLAEDMELYENEVTHKLPDDWFGFYRDGDFYVGRHFESLEQIEELQLTHLLEEAYEQPSSLRETIYS